jgi:hypothetical protein
MKRVTSSLKSMFLGNFCAMLLVLSFTRLGTRSETCNILVSGCIGHVEPSRVRIIMPKIMTKLRFGFDIIL